ncbi:larval cuticle protein LCP-22-like [Maniola hyperantus]|uniref:larval cuticle protein LCP-22-like n=1 Tax=Aphantopus hyperantus TaxID=2795564 RepID=UPI00156A08C4|nr:larval cuticle protein LCP-22-like [Maniola hyperantus]
MRFAVVVLACVVAVAHAQLIPNTGRYNPDSGRYQANRYNPNQYNKYNKNQYNRYNTNQYNPFNNQYNRNQQNQYTPFKPFVTSTPFPRPSVTVTPAPSVAPKLTPAPVITPVVTPTPFVPVAPVAPIAPVPFVPGVTAARVAADARSAETVKYGNEINPDGSYSYFYETNNGIAAQAEGVPRNFGGNPPVIPDVAQGSFSWYAPEGQVIAINWVADENGYRATGDAIPQPPPVPDQIARALAYVARSAPVPAVLNANYNN